MSAVESFIAEDAINGEEFAGAELLSLGQVIRKHLQVPGGNGCCVSPQDVLEGLIRIPRVVETDAAVSSHLVDLSGLLKVFLIFHNALRGRAEEESVVGVAGGMGLRLEERVEVPEGALNVAISLHLLEAHLGQDFGELLFCLHQRVQVSVVNCRSLRIWIELLELVGLPQSIGQHGAGELSLDCFQFLLIVSAFPNDVDVSMPFLSQFPPLELPDDFRCQFCFIFQFEPNQLISGLIGEPVLGSTDDVFLDEDEFVLDGVAEGQLVSFQGGKFLTKSLLVHSLYSCG